MCGFGNTKGFGNQGGRSIKHGGYSDQFLLNGNN